VRPAATCGLSTPAHTFFDLCFGSWHLFGGCEFGFGKSDTEFLPFPKQGG
jgi:hypothetical protein